MSTQNYDTLFKAIREKCYHEHWYGPDMDDPDWWDKCDRQDNIQNVYPPAKKQLEHPQRLNFAYPPVTESQLQVTETTLGFPLPPLLRALYAEVANGGFGPAYGLIGVREGFPGPGMGTLEDYYPHAPEPCRIITLSDCPLDAEATAHSPQPHLIVPDDAWPEHLLMICEYGCCIYFYVDACTDQVFESYVNKDGFAVLTVIAPTLEAWLTHWTRDEPITSPGR